MSNVDTVRAHYRAGARGDIEAMFRPFAPRVRWTEAAGGITPGTFVGIPQVVENVFAVIGGLIDDFKCVPKEFYEAGDVVIMIGSYSGTYKASGKSFTARVVHKWRFNAAGTVIAFEQIVDSHPMWTARALLD